MPVLIFDLSWNRSGRHAVGKLKRDCSASNGTTACRAACGSHRSSGDLRCCLRVPVSGVRTAGEGLTAPRLLSVPACLASNANDMGGPHGIPQTRFFRHQAGKGHSPASRRRRHLARAATCSSAREWQAAFAWRRSACPRPDRAALRSRRPTGCSARGSAVREPAAGAADAEPAAHRFAARDANAHRRADPRRAPAKRAVRRHGLARSDPHHLAGALAQDARTGVDRGGACVGHRCARGRTSLSRSPPRLSP